MRPAYDDDATRVGLGFIPAAHELTGALGPAARDELFTPALRLLKLKKLGAICLTMAVEEPPEAKFVKEAAALVADRLPSPKAAAGLDN